MAYLDFIQEIHRKTQRNYLLRVTDADKAECAEKALQFGYDYWDGDRTTGYGGYRYDGRWRPFAEKLAAHYGIKPGDRILDIGCGKGFLLYDFTQVVPGVEVVGLDVSDYALEHAREEVKPFLVRGNAIDLPFPDDSFDFIVSVNVLHNLYNYQLRQALQEIERVGTGRAYLIIDAYRNEREKVNLFYWQLTCRCFYTPEEWEWFFKESGYTGDYGAIYYE